MRDSMKEFWKYKFINPDPTLRSNLMAFGFEIGEGWIPIMHVLCKNIQAVIDSDPEKYKDFEFTQVKEKWGGLRVYCNRSFDEIEELIEAARSEADKTCEVCGKRGKLREDRPWIQTLCDRCSKEVK